MMTIGCVLKEHTVEAKRGGNVEAEDTHGRSNVDEDEEAR